MIATIIVAKLDVEFIADMARVCTTWPWVIENGTLQLSQDLARDEQDILATILTRIPERIMRPYQAGTPDYTFRANQTPNIISNKLAVAIEEQCPSIKSVIGVGEITDDGTVTARFYWTPKQEPETTRLLTIGVS